MIKTTEQERAKLCFLCVKRIKIVPNDKWIDLQSEEEKKLLPSEIENFKKFKTYDGLKREIYKDFLAELKKKKDDNLFKDILDRDNKFENNKTRIKNLLEDTTLILEITENDKKLFKELIDRWKNEKLKNFDYSKDYSSHSKNLSQMIITNGLIPTLIFYKSKEKDRAQIYEDLCEMMEIMFRPYKTWRNSHLNSKLIEFLLDSDSNTLRLATMEALTLANWLKRIVEVEIEED